MVGTCAVTGYDNETCEEAVFDEETVGIQELVITDRGDETETNGYITGNGVNLLLAFFAFLGKVFEVRNRNAEELHNDRRCDIRVDTECEQGCLRERTTG